MLKGDLATTPIETVLADFAAEEATGCLHVVNDDGDEALVYLKTGLVYAVSVPGQRPQLGSRLISSNALVPENLAEALEAQRTELQGWRLGELLVHLGFVEQDVVEAFVQEQVRDGFTDLMAWRTGRWRFRKAEKTREDVAPPTAVATLLAEVRARQTAWEEIVSAVHGPNAVPMLAARGGEADVVLDPDTWSLLCKIDGERSLAELARECGFTLFEAGNVVRALVEAGLVDVEEDLDPDDDAHQPTPAAEEGEPAADEGDSEFPRVAALAAAFALSGRGGDAADERIELEVTDLRSLPVEETSAPESAPAPEVPALARVAAALTNASAPAKDMSSFVDPFHVPDEIRLRAKPKPKIATTTPSEEELRRERIRQAAAAELAAAHAEAEALRKGEHPGAGHIADVVDLEARRAAARADAERRATEDEERAEAARLDAERLAAEEEAARLEAERLEAERLAAEEAARIEAERVAAEEEAARLEAERLAAEEAARIEAERVAAEEEAARLEAERLAAEEAARIEAERLAAEEAARLEAERLEAERLAAEEAARIEAERLAAEEEAARLEAERLAAEEAARIEAARIEAERLEAERLEAERLEAERLEAERLAAEEAAHLEAERLEAERLAAEEAARLEAERLAAEEAARLEAERLEAERLEAERLAAEEAARLEAERLAAEEAARIEAERLEAERLAAEEAARIEAERVAAEEAARAQAEEAARLEAERLATDEAARAEEAARARAEMLEAQRRDHERQIAEEAARAEEARIAAERAEAERLAALDQMALNAPDPHHMASATAMLSEFSRTGALTLETAESEPEPEPERELPDPMAQRDLTDTASLLRELSSLGFEDEPSGPPPVRPAPSQARPATPVSAAAQKKKRGLFGR